MPEREMPKRRTGVTYHVSIATVSGRVKLYLRTGVYEDGTLGEIFLDVARHGTSLRSMFECWARLFSVALQNGVPLVRLIRSFEGTDFEPKGSVECAVEGIGKCTSIPDLICQVLKAEFISK